MSDKFTPDREYIARMYVEYGLASVDSEYLGDQKMEDLLRDEINRGLDRITGGRTEKRVLQPWQAVNGLTMWYDETLWLPFIEDEDANIIGPGHQNKAAFAALVNHFDAYASGEPLSDNWGPDDISHGWVQVYEHEDGEIYFKPTASHDPGGVAVTTLWGAR